MQHAILALADGSVFRGRAIGAHGSRCGELVFNTAMTGYQEILTDPSYAGQIVTLTYPHIGNTGVNALDVESGALQAAGLVVRDAPATYSSWRASGSHTASSALPTSIPAKSPAACAPTAHKTPA